MAGKSETATACWPTATQEYLLKAVLLKNNGIFTAWENWLSHVDFFEDKLDGGSYQLLPLLYRNFLTLEVNDPLLGRLKGLVRNTWTRNQILVQSIIPVLRMLDRTSIRTLLLHRAALALVTYADTSMVLIQAFDIYIPPADITNAITLITQNGEWSLQNTASKQRGVYSAGISIFLNKNGQRLKLHKRLPFHSKVYRGNLDSWENTTPAIVQDVNTYTLCPAEQILAMCFDGLYANRILAVDWIAHIAYIINKQSDEIDWRRLLTMAQKHHLVFALRHTLHYLAKTFNVAVPKSQLSILDDNKVSQQERREWRIVTKARSGFWSQPLRLLRLWFGFRRISADGNGSHLRYIPDFYRYLQE